MGEEEDMLPPFWLQSDGGRRRRLRRSYSLLFSSGALFMVIIVTACVIVFIVLPTLRSFTSHIFRPQLVKKRWDSLNLVLVLFAIVCGFLSRNNSNETPRSYEDRSFSEAASAREYVKSNPETPTRRWYEYSESDRTAFNRMRSFNSYPDLRHESLWVAGDERWRFHDDTHVGGYRGSDLDDRPQLRHRRVRSEVIEEEHDAVKNIAVDTFVVRAKEVPTAPPIPKTRQPPPSQHPQPPSPPQVQPTEVVRRYAKRTYHTAGRSEMIEKEEKDQLEVIRSQPPYYTMATSSPPPALPANGVRKNSRRTYRSSRPAPMIEKEETSELEVRNFPPPPPSIPPPPSPPPLPLFYLSSEKKTDHGKKKRGSATKEFLTSLRGKKKKQRQRSVENFESLLNSQASPLPRSTPPPPPPPPPPPAPSVFYNLFSPRKPRHKKVHTVSPPPGALSPQPVLSARVSKTQKPPISNEREIFNSMEGNILTGNESPFHRIPPPPPPPPPFGIPAWKFRVQGDFVRINSVRSSRSNSPDIDEESVDSPTNQEQPTTPPLFCPSPDVDNKADTFIARFRAGLKLEKMNSMKGKSNLGPS